MKLSNYTEGVRAQPQAGRGPWLLLEGQTKGLVLTDDGVVSRAYALQPPILHLTQTALHRCMQCRDISRLANIKHDKPKCQKFSPCQ